MGFLFPNKELQFNRMIVQLLFYKTKLNADNILEKNPLIKMFGFAFLLNNINFFKIIITLLQ